MIRKGMTVDEAAHEWVREFNAIDTDMIRELMDVDPYDWKEITKPAAGCRVYDGDEREDGEILRYDEDEELYTVKLDNGETVEAEERDLDVYSDDEVPMWGKMWSFGDNLDDYWLEEEDGLRVMSDCGFRIFHSEQFGYFFGVDGAGYDFYSAHWIPLYKARGLCWHDPEAEKKEA